MNKFLKSCIKRKEELKEYHKRIVHSLCVEIMGKHRIGKRVMNFGIAEDSCKEPTWRS